MTVPDQTPQKGKEVGGGEGRERGEEEKGEVDGIQASLFQWPIGT